VGEVALSLQEVVLLRVLRFRAGANWPVEGKWKKRSKFKHFPDM
jgi:hypothetical protein